MRNSLTHVGAVPEHIALSGERALVAARIRDSEIDVPVKRAMLWLLAFQVADEPVEKDDERCPPHSVADLARRYHASREHLTRLAAEGGMPLALFVCCNLCITGLELILAGVSLDEVAWRLGYQAGDGLADRIQQTFGRKPGEFV